MERYKSTPHMRLSLIAALVKAWDLHPELRLGQLISNTIGEKDLFYIRDEHLLSRLELKANSPDPLQKRKYQDGFKFNIGELQLQIFSAFINEAESPTIFYTCYYEHSPVFEATILAEYIIDGCVKNEHTRTTR